MKIWNIILKYISTTSISRIFSFSFQINWYDHHGNLVNDATYRSYRMRDSKLFEARSQMTFTPRREHHNQTSRCEAWNEAGDNLRPALARLFVQYAPSVTVTPVRPGMIQEGDKVTKKAEIKFKFWVYFSVKSISRKIFVKTISMFGLKVNWKVLLFIFLPNF